MKENKAKYRTDFLLPNNNFFVGFGSVLNVAGAYFDYNYSKNENETDLKALYSDWQNVGNDLKDAKKKIENRINLGLSL